MSAVFRAAASTAVLRAALAVTSAGAALAAGAGTASAAGELHDPGAALKYALRPVTQLQLEPLAKTGTDPLSNGVATQIGDVKPVGTPLVTKPVTDGASLSQLPVVGPVTKTVTGH